MRGLRPEDVAARPILADNIVVGSLADYGVDDGILIGARLAQQLGVSVGGNVTLVSPSGNTTVMGTIPRMKTYRIAGLFEVGMYEYDNGFIYMPLDAAQTFFRLPEAVTAIEVFVCNPNNADDAPPRLQTGPGPRQQA